MATITKTIGSGKDYATPQAWWDDRNNGAIYSSGDEAVGVIDEVLVWDSHVQLAGAITSGIVSAKLTVAEAYRHDGTAGSGARMVASAERRFTMTAAIPITVEWIEWDWNGFDSALGSGNISGSGTKTVRQCLFHDWFTNNTNNKRMFLVFSGGVFHCHNSLLYNLNCGTGVGVEFIRTLAGAVLIAANNTLYNSSDVGIDCDVNDANQIIRNNAIFNCGTNCLELQASNVKTNNLTSDATGNITNKTAADQFVSVTGGSEDLHLKAGSDALSVGATLVTPSGVEIDIDGTDRTSPAVAAWDIGAHQLTGPAPPSVSRPTTLLTLGVG